MPNSPPNPPSNPKTPDTQKRICDFCSESTALLYCKADSAKLCLPCDREVHSTNQLFTKHTRFQLCDNCDSSSASILCVTHHSVFCQNCDFEVHDNLAGSCERRPLEGFSGCPSASDIAANLGFEGFDSKCWREEERGGVGVGFLSGLEEGEEESDGFSDLFVWETPAVVNIDELIDSTSKSHSFQAAIAPPLPKDRNLSCGQHRHEMLNQLHKLAKSEFALNQDSHPLARLHNVADENEEEFRMEHMFRAYQHGEEHATLRGHEARSYTQVNDGGEAVNESALPGTYVEESVLICDKQSSVCSGSVQNPVHIDLPVPALPPKVATFEFCAAGRDSALSRYKEKKRTRRYEKLIRYESRKVQAEHRKRIKGRFAKIGHTLNQA